MNRLAMLEGVAKKLRVPAHCEAYAKRSVADSLEVVVAYQHKGKKYFCVACFLDKWSDREVERRLYTAYELTDMMRDAIRKGLPE